MQKSHLEKSETDTENSRGDTGNRYREATWKKRIQMQNSHVEKPENKFRQRGETGHINREAMWRNRKQIQRNCMEKPETCTVQRSHVETPETDCFLLLYL